ncbi:MAG: flagellar motor switch protein FliM [Deltaproteobacteria bacterium]|nr:flagellar motor switch protein FliM [Deltaproteobacteria bacterium]
MSEQILSQMEVDALLKGLSDGDVKTEPEGPKRPGEAAPYDFSRHTRVVLGRMPTLDMISEKFCRSVRAPLFNLLRKTIDVRHEPSAGTTFGEFLRNLNVPSSLNLFQLSPLRGQGLLVLDPNLVFVIVDSYFGGSGRFHTRIEGREFTTVEQTVIRKVAQALLNDMAEVWKPVHPIEFRYVKAEMNPQFVNIITHTEPVIVSSFKMELENAAERFFFCMPYSSLEPIKDKLQGTGKSAEGEEDSRWRGVLRDTIGDVPLRLSCEIGKARINLSDLINLKTGDVILLDKKARDPADVYIEGIRKIYGKPGIVDNNYAFKVMFAQKERS